MILVVEFDPDVEVVVPKVAYAEGMYRVFVLQHIVDKKPKAEAAWGDYGQCAAVVMASMLLGLNRCHLRHDRKGKEKEKGK